VYDKHQNRTQMTQILLVFANGLSKKNEAACKQKRI